MNRSSSWAAIGMMVLAGVLGVVGLWLPWVRKQPVGTRDGVPIYTSEWVQGLSTEFHGSNAITGVGIFGIVVVSGLLAWRNRRPDTVLLVGGGVLVWYGGEKIIYFWESGGYTLRSGLFLLTLAGMLFVVLGAGGILRNSGIGTETILESQ